VPKFLTPVDLNKNELRNPVIQNLASAPSSPTGGLVYYDTTLKQFGCYQNNAWVYLGAVTSAAIIAALTFTPENAANKNAASGYAGLDSSSHINASVLTAALITGALTYTPENPANKGAVNGYAGLDSGGKVPAAQLPSSVTGGMAYQGTWNANTNVPALASGVGTKGYLYKVSVAGTTTLDTISQWNVGDSVVFDGTTWDKIDGVASEVVTVAGRAGAVVLAYADVSGLASMAQQAASSVAITGGTITGLSSALPVTSGGTGGNTAALAKAALGFTTKYAADVGDGSTLSYVVTHNLNTTDVHVAVSTKASTFDVVYPDIQITSVNTITLIFAVAPTAAQYRCVVIG